MSSRPFINFSPPSATFALRSERDHLFSFQHFIDWVTSERGDANEIGVEESLAEGVIYSFNSTDPASALLFKTETTAEFGVCSISCVRFKEEVSILMLAGQQCDLKEQTSKIREVWNSVKWFKHRQHVEPAESLELRAEPLSNEDGMWKTVVLMRFDLTTKTVDARYVFKDWGTSYQGLSDDSSAYEDANGEFLSADAKDAFQQAVSSLKEYDTLFELGKTALLLPSFFVAHDDDVVIERHPTEFKNYRAGIKNKKVIERVDPKYWITYRDVRVLRKPSARWPDRGEFEAPPYKVERNGFWKTLPIDVEGRDKHGRPIHGRTWVSQNLSWVEEAPAGRMSFASQGKSLTAGDDPGFIYVMRSAAHKADVFKIGLTRRTSEDRAKELTRSTASPDKFLVVQEWATNDCAHAERLIHAQLAAYRMNPSREFFAASYRIIFSAIDEVISRLERDASHGAGTPLATGD